MKEFIINKLCCGLLLALPMSGFSQQPEKPNIVIILADDLGWGDVGYHGSDIQTPNIDQLSREGVILNRYYTAPICSPTRVGLLTGRYPERVGIRETTIPPWSDFGLDTSEVLLPQMLAEAGYRHRAMIGKWHLGHATLKYHPMRRGFTHFYGHLNGAIDYFTHEREGETDWHNDYEHSPDEGYSTDLISDEAVKCIEEYTGESPFFLYVAYNAPHGPYQAKEEDLRLYGYDENKPVFGQSPTGEDAKSGTRGHGNTIRQTYKAMVTCMDRGIGRILQALKDQGIEENTLVLFHSDNGAAGNGKSGSSGELRGFKFQEWEGGVRSPAVVKWPAAFQGGRTADQVMGYIDVVPTVREVAGIESKPGKPLDGISMLPIFRGDKQQIDREIYLGHGAIIRNDWKLVKAGSGNPRMKIKEDHLFRIPPDFTESGNLKSSHADIYKQLREAVIPFEAITAKEAILKKGPRGDFVAPKNWKITKE